MNEHRSISLPKGGSLELEMTPAFLDRVRQQFNLPSGCPVTDDHLRMFVYGATRNALDRAGLQ